MKKKLDWIRGLAAAQGRELTYGIRLHVIVRETTAEAWDAAERLISRLDDATIAKAQETFARMDSVGQRRMAELHGGRTVIDSTLGEGTAISVRLPVGRKEA